MIEKIHMKKIREMNKGYPSFRDHKYFLNEFLELERQIN